MTLHPRRRTDIAIDGLTFFQLAARTPAGRRFMQHVQGVDDAGVAYSDDRRLTQTIADGACRARLRVSVNGRLYRVQS